MIQVMLLTPRRREGLAWVEARNLLCCCYFIGFWKIVKILFTIIK